MRALLFFSESAELKTAKRSVDATFMFIACAKDFDPDAHIMYRSISALRRLMSKRPTSIDTVKLIIMLHLSSTTGTDHHTGPIAGLLQQMHACNATIGADFVMRQNQEPSINPNGSRLPTK